MYFRYVVLFLMYVTYSIKDVKGLKKIEQLILAFHYGAMPFTFMRYTPVHKLKGLFALFMILYFEGFSFL